MREREREPNLEDTMKKVEFGIRAGSEYEGLGPCCHRQDERLHRESERENE